MSDNNVRECPFCKHKYEFWPISLANGGALATYDWTAIECACGAVIAKAPPGRKAKDLKESG